MRQEYSIKFQRQRGLCFKHCSDYQSIHQPHTSFQWNKVYSFPQQCIVGANKLQVKQFFLISYINLYLLSYKVLSNLYTYLCYHQFFSVLLQNPRFFPLLYQSYFSNLLIISIAHIWAFLSLPPLKWQTRIINTWLELNTVKR